MREAWAQSLGWEDILEKGWATHSSNLAWRILWTEEPGKPQSVGSQRVRHNWTVLCMCVEALGFSTCKTMSLHVDYLVIESRTVPLYISGILVLPSSLLSRTLPCKHYSLQPPETPISVSLTFETTELCLGCPFRLCSLETSSGRKPGKLQAYLFISLLPGITILCCVTV